MILRSLSTSWIAICAMVVVLAAFSLSAGEPVAVTMQGMVEQNTARIRLDMQQPMRFKAAVEGDDLVIHFDEPVNANTLNVLSSLRDVVMGVSSSQDGRSVRFALMEPVSVESFANGVERGVIIHRQAPMGNRHSGNAAPLANVKAKEVAKPAAKEAPPVTPPTAEKPQEAEALSVSASPKADGSVVLAFDWNQRASYRLFDKNNKIVVEFNKTAQHAPVKLTNDVTKLVKKLASRSANGHLVYSIETKEPVTLKHRRDGNRVIVEFIPKKAPEAPAKETAVAAVAAPQPTAPAAQGFVTEGNQRTSASTIRVSAQELPDQNRYQPIHASAAATPAAALVPTVTRDGTSISLSFDWPDNTAMASFADGTSGWMVFNRPARLDMSAIKAANMPYANGFTQLEHPNATILSYRHLTPHVVATRREGNRWVVTFREGDKSQTQPLQLQMAADETGLGRVTIAMREFGAPITLLDQHTGERLAAIPLGRAGFGIMPGQKLVDGDILSSHQGVGLRLRRDDVRLEPAENGITITGPAGMSISPDLPEPPPTLADDYLETGKLFPYERWKTPEDSSYNQELVKHLRHLTNAAETNPSPFRLRLAQHYLANSMLPEALAMLDMIKARDPEFAQARHVEALRGIALFSMGSLTDAKQAFAAPELKGIKEVSMWQQLAEIAVGEAIAPLRPEAWWDEYLYGYAPVVNQKTAFVLADKYLKDKNPAKALEALDRLSKNQSMAGVEEQAQFATGMIAAASKKYAEAITLWEPLTMQNKNQRAKVMATLALTELQYNTQQIDIKKAIERLEAVKLDWRGDDLEREVLRSLGQLYIDDGQLKKGLTAWKELVTEFPNTETAQAIATRMSDVFIQQFNRGGADDMSPLEALSLYYEFRELTPLGPDGDTMIQNLADRLLQVDLLDRAAALLTHQVRYRLQGEDQARVGNKLAYIQLLNQQPEMAVETIQSTQHDGLPEEIMAERRHLLATALLQTGKLADAFRLVEEDSSDAGEQIAIDVLWKMQDWPRTVAYLEKLLKKPVTELKEGETIPAARAQNILRLAIARQFTNDRQGLADLKSRYEAEMVGSEYAESFEFLTEKMIDINHTNLARMEGIIRRFDGFLKQFQSKKTAEKPE